ncbi:MAG: DUF3239 domain-containing protein [Rhodococcus sp.]|nr:DUF3239 domain-containing protein [Rhodococcus sp. (in: high G+C Gram-positive bacteria)]
MRHIDFEVDRAHARSVNQTLGDMRRLQFSSALVALALVAGAVGLFFVGRAWATVLGFVLVAGAVTCVWLVLWVPRKVGSIDDLYRDNPVVPAVVGALQPRGVTLLSLLDVAKPGNEPKYALVTRNIARRPLQRLRVGDRVPAVALCNDRSRHSTDDTWEMVTIMPIEWGTRDAGVLARAEAEIPAVEWDFLASRIDETEAIRTSRLTRQLIPADEWPDELR